jgi:lipoprotein-anchoring transpeptidase ErfK/SrfK
MRTWTCLVVCGALAAGAAGQTVIDGVTFANDPGKLYVPVREAGQALGWAVGFDEESQEVRLNDRLVSEVKRLLDGTTLMPVRNLSNVGASVEWDAEAEVAIVEAGEQRLRVRLGEKRVHIDKSNQEMIGWQGEREVFRSNVSTGRDGYRTPTGSYTFGPYKARMHYSSQFDNAPMPWSVQIVRGIFVHGYSSVPDVPASHGCIRLPVTGANPARWFFEWVEIGTPVEITGQWRS